MYKDSFLKKQKGVQSCNLDDSNMDFLGVLHQIKINPKPAAILELYNTGYFSFSFVSISLFFLIVDIKFLFLLYILQDSDSLFLGKDMFSKHNPDSWKVCKENWVREGLNCCQDIFDIFHARM